MTEDETPPTDESGRSPPATDDSERPSPHTNVSGDPRPAGEAGHTPTPGHGDAPGRAAGTGRLPELSVSNVVKDYGPVVALGGVDLSFEGGQLHCLAGPNGSGKSTLFRILLGLTRPTAGTVTRPSGKQLGASFQEPAFYDSLTVAENFDVFKSLAGNPDDEWLDRIVDVFNLNRVAHRKAANLSGGFSKQLDLALSLLKRPCYLLLDEPLTDLDDVTGESLLQFLREYADEGNAVIVSSHRIGEFSPTLDRLTVMDRGSVVFDELRENINGTDPANIERVYREAIENSRD